MVERSLHIAIIMDGNGRWGTQQGLSRIQGHTEGATRVKEIIMYVAKKGISTLTIWGYSTDNWKRNDLEVAALLSLFQRSIIDETDELQSNNVAVTFIGDRVQLPEKLQSVMSILEEKTRENTGLKLQIALNYGGIDELVRAVTKIKKDNLEVSEETLRASLDTAVISDPDIIIRTGMPQAVGKLSQWRSSGFMPIQSAQSVCISTEVLWPDFTPDHLEEIIAYAKPKERLFGGQR